MVVCAPFTSPLLMYARGALELRPSLQHPIEDYQHQMGDRHYGTFFPSSRSQLLESSGKYRALFADCGPSALN